MFKLFVFAVILAFAASAPAPGPKPGLLAPLGAPLAYTSPLNYGYNSYNLPLSYSSLNTYAPGYYNNYYSSPLAYNYGGYYL